MTHPLVTQLRFARAEWLRALADIPPEDARRRLLPMNSISWIAAHLAWHEQSNWLYRAQGKILVPAVIELGGYGKPPSAPPLDEMLEAWRTITAAADLYLDALTTAEMQSHWTVKGKPAAADIGTTLLRVIYHYWYHTGEIMAIRQMLGHPNLPEFVGDIDTQAPYQPE